MTDLNALFLTKTFLLSKKGGEWYISNPPLYSVESRASGLGEEELMAKPETSPNVCLMCQDPDAKPAYLYTKTQLQDCLLARCSLPEFRVHSNWHHRLEFEQTLGGGEGQGSMACYSPRGRKELATEQRESPRALSTIAHLSFFWIKDNQSSICWPEDPQKAATGGLRQNESLPETHPICGMVCVLWKQTTCHQMLSKLNFRKRKQRVIICFTQSLTNTMPSF